MGSQLKVVLVLVGVIGCALIWWGVIRIFRYVRGTESRGDLLVLVGPVGAGLAGTIVCAVITAIGLGVQTPPMDLILIAWGMIIVATMLLGWIGSLRQSSEARSRAVGGLPRRPVVCYMLRDSVPRLFNLTLTVITGALCLKTVAWLCAAPASDLLDVVYYTVAWISIAWIWRLLRHVVSQAEWREGGLHLLYWSGRERVLQPGTLRIVKLYQLTGGPVIWAKWEGGAAAFLGATPLLLDILCRLLSSQADEDGAQLAS